MLWCGTAVRWRGLPSYQLPEDLWRYGQLIIDRRPDWIINTGCAPGGTDSFLRDVCKLTGHGRVIGVDIEEAPYDDPWYIVQGDSVIEASRIARLVADGSCMVILDSDVYSTEHCLAEIRAYAPLVTLGQVLVVCHTNREDWGVQPALRAFLADHHNEFSRLPDLNDTLNPGGYLLREKPA